jgi:uncharacterized protein YjiS (DUF1127 family)
MEVPMLAFPTTRNVRLALPRTSVRSLVKAILEMDRRYRSRVRLDELDDHMLRDIGITRADVDAELRRPLF